MHESYHINRDLPLNPAAMPAEPVCIDQPVRVLNPVDDRRLTRCFLQTNVFWCGVLTLLLAGIGHLVLPVSVAVWLPLLAVLAACVWSLQLARHGIAIWTGLPVDLKTSRALRTSLVPAACLLSSWPWTAMLLWQRGQSPQAASTVAIIGVAVGVFFWMAHPIATLRAYAGAVVSFLTYNRQESRSPGLLFSPAGRCPRRQVLLAATLQISATLIPGFIRITPGVGPRQVATWLAPPVPSPFDADLSWEDIRARIITVIRPLLTRLLLLTVSGPVVVFGIGFLTTAPVLTTAYRAQLEAGDEDHVWSNNTIERMRASKNKHVRTSVWLGSHVSDDSPAMVPRAVFTEHGLLTGPTGSNKSTAVNQLSRQLTVNEPASLFFFNMKGKELTQLDVVESIRQEAEERFKMSIPLKIYTNIPGLGVHACNPCDQTNRDRLDLDQFVGNLLTASNLSYGRGFGQGHFSTANEYVLRRATESRPGFRSFRELYQALANEPTSRVPSQMRQLQEHGADVIAVLEKLAAIEGLNVTNNGTYSAEQIAGRIDFSAPENIFTRPEIYYFHFSVDHGPELAALQANLILHTFFNAASSEQLRRRVPVWCVIDEVQELLQRQLGSFYRLARSAGVGLIAATQSEANLRDGGLDLRDVVRDNSCIHLRTGIHNDDEQLRVVNTSGEVVQHVTSFGQSTNSTGRTSTSVGWQEQRDVRLNQNIVKAASAGHKLAILEVKRNFGYSAYDGQKVIIRMRYDVTPEEHRQRERRTWPAPGAEQIIQRSGLSATPPAAPTPVINTIPGDASAAPPQKDQKPQTITTIFDQLRDEQKRRHQASRSRRRRRKKDQ